METVILDYHLDDLPGTGKSVQDALDLGAQRVILDLDSLAVLDAKAVRGLIGILRSSRVAGSADVALRSSNRDVLRTLNVTALDRLFPVLESKPA